MPLEDKVYVGDVGTLFELYAKIDLTGVATLKMKVIKPDGTTAEWAATVKSGDNTKAQHTILAGELDQTGKWKIQVYAEWSSSQKWHGDTFPFKVYALGK